MRETIVALGKYIVKRGVLIGSTTKLGSGSSGVSTRRNLNRNPMLPMLPIATTKIVGIPQMVFTKSITYYSCEHNCKSATNEFNGY
jgi:hypothetical protein